MIQKRCVNPFYHRIKIEPSNLLTVRIEICKNLHKSLFFYCFCSIDYTWFNFFGAYPYHSNHIAFFGGIVVGEILHFYIAIH